VRLLSPVLNLILVSAYFFLNSQYPEPEIAEAVLSLSPFFMWGCYFRENSRLWFWRSLFEGLRIFYVGDFFSLFLLKEEPLIGVNYWSSCFFLYVLTWIPGEMNPTRTKISWKCHIIPYFFQNVIKDFPSDTNFVCCCFSWGKKEMKTHCDSDTERKNAYHATEKQREVCLNLSTHVLFIHSPGSSSSKTFRCIRYIVYFKSTKRLSVVSRPSYKPMLFKHTVQSCGGE